MAWTYVILAGCLEAFGVMMMNGYAHTRKWRYVIAMAVGFAISFVLLSLGMRTLSMGTAYAVWTGIGAVGGTVLGMIFYGESKNWKRILCIALIISATIGLKLAS